MPARRAYLAGLAGVGLSLVAGCSGANPTDDTTTTSTTRDPVHVPTRLPWGEAGEVDGTTVRPAAAWAQHATLHLTSADQMGVSGFGDRQACFVRVRVSVGADGPTPALGDFSLRAAGESSTAKTRLGVAAPYRVFPDEAAYGTDYPTDSGGGWFAFLLPPSLPADVSPTLVVQFGGEAEGGLRWPLPEAAVAALRAPAPDFAVRSLDVPDSVAPDEPIEVSWAVENRGGPATFHAALNEQGPRYFPHQLRTHVPAGERVPASVTVEPNGEWGADAVDLAFRSVPRDADWSVTVESGTTTA